MDCPDMLDRLLMPTPPTKLLTELSEKSNNVASKRILRISFQYHLGGYNLRMGIISHWLQYYK